MIELSVESGVLGAPGGLNSVSSTTTANQQQYNRNWNVDLVQYVDKNRSILLFLYASKPKAVEMSGEGWGDVLQHLLLPLSLPG